MRCADNDVGQSVPVDIPRIGHGIPGLISIRTTTRILKPFVAAKLPRSRFAAKAGGNPGFQWLNR